MEKTGSSGRRLTRGRWGAAFAAAGREYPAPTLVLFDGAVQSACGRASAAPTWWTPAMWPPPARHVCTGTTR